MARLSFGVFWSSARALFTNLYLWGGLLGLVLLGGGFYLLMDLVVMPFYTRHEVSIPVPEVRNLPFTEAAAQLEAADLQVEQQVQRFNPDLPRDVVVDQNPAPNALVKPGRRIYLTTNSGIAPQVRVPPLEGTALREAKSRLQSVGLKVSAEIADSIPSPHPGTVTRQDPRPGTQLPQGSGVTLWFSTGLGDRYVSVPPLSGLTVTDALKALADKKLRWVIIGAVTVPDTQTVKWQSQEAGTSVREGFEVRLSTSVHEEPPPLRPVEPDVPPDTAGVDNRP
jgi:beta-lactam-binding protein with PASTA domain